MTTPNNNEAEYFSKARNAWAKVQEIRGIMLEETCDERKLEHKAELLAYYEEMRYAMTVYSCLTGGKKVFDENEGPD